MFEDSIGCGTARQSAPRRASRTRVAFPAGATRPLCYKASASYWTATGLDIRDGPPRLPAFRRYATASPRSLDCWHIPQFPGTTLPVSVTPLSQTSHALPRRMLLATLLRTDHRNDQQIGGAWLGNSSAIAVSGHVFTSKPAASSRVTWEGIPSRYFVIEVPHHPGSWRRNLSGGKNVPCNQPRTPAIFSKFGCHILLNVAPSYFILLSLA